MKNEGKKFEEDFINSFTDDIFTYRLRDSAGAWNNGNKARFTSKNGCDFIIFNTIKGELLLLELKSFKGKSCSFSNVKAHQIQFLTEESKKEGVRGLFILNFRDLEETYILEAEDVNKLYLADKKSISLAFCRKNGQLLPQKLKRIRYEYNVDILIQ